MGIGKFCGRGDGGDIMGTGWGLETRMKWAGKKINQVASVGIGTMGDFTFWIIQHDHPEVRAYPVANPKSEVVFFV